MIYCCHSDLSDDFTLGSHPNELLELQSVPVSQSFRLPIIAPAVAVFIVAEQYQELQVELQLH